MAGDALAGAIRTHAPEIVADVQVRLRDDPAIAEMAGSRGTSETAFTSQVLGFWLQGIETDLALGTTLAMQESLTWLGRLRTGHALAFDDDMVRRMFADICVEIESRLDDAAMLAEFEAYRTSVTELIADAFPGTKAPEQ